MKETVGHFLKSELAPSKMRVDAFIRYLICSAVVILTSVTLDIPFMTLSLIIVFMTTMEDAKSTLVAGLMMILGTTLIDGLLSMPLMAYTFDYPLARIIVAFGLVFLGMFTFRISPLGVLGYMVALSIVFTQSSYDQAPDPEVITRITLWSWVALTYAIAVTIAVNMLFRPVKSGVKKEGKMEMLAKDAWTNPVYTQFAFKTTLAAFLCYAFYKGVQWEGIHTCMATCIVVALPGLGEVSQKIILRVSGCAIGSLLAFLSVIFVMPHLESIAGFLVLSLVVIGAGAWVAAGSKRINYAGMQMVFAYVLAVGGTYGPSTNLAEIRDRLIGILIGICVSGLVFALIWPEKEKEKTTAEGEPA